MNPREELKRRLVRERVFCEGNAFKEHQCRGGLHLHEVFYKRNDCKTTAQKKYIINERNCAIVCGFFHQRYGHSRAFTEWFAGVQADNFDDLKEYLECAPFKVKTTLGSMLPED